MFIVLLTAFRAGQEPMLGQEYNQCIKTPAVLLPSAHCHLPPLAQPPLPGRMGMGPPPYQ